jgi:hypothetical protein
MLIDHHDPEDVFARVAELASQTDPVLVALDRLLDNDGVYQQVRGDLVRSSRLTSVHGRHSTPGEVLLRLLMVKRLYTLRYAETVERVASRYAAPRVRRARNAPSQEDSTWQRLYTCGPRSGMRGKGGRSRSRFACA